MAVTSYRGVGIIPYEYGGVFLILSIAIQMVIFEKYGTSHQICQGIFVQVLEMIDGFISGIRDPQNA